MSAVSKNLKRIRQAKGMTQDQLADALHVTRQAVSSWETGRSEPDIETLLALAEALGTNADEMIYGPKAPQYAPMQRKYKICCIVFSLTCLAGFAARIWLRLSRRCWLRKDHISSSVPSSKRTMYFP